jgi:hypothetical protein
MQHCGQDVKSDPGSDWSSEIAGVPKQKHIWAGYKGV